MIKKYINIIDLSLNKIKRLNHSQHSLNSLLLNKSKKFQYKITNDQFKKKIMYVVNLTIKYQKLYQTFSLMTFYNPLFQPNHPKVLRFSIIAGLSFSQVHCTSTAHSHLFSCPGESSITFAIYNSLSIIAAWIYGLLFQTIYLHPSLSRQTFAFSTIRIAPPR